MGMDDARKSDYLEILTAPLIKPSSILILRGLQSSGSAGLRVGHRKIAPLLHGVC